MIHYGQDQPNANLICPKTETMIFQLSPMSICETAGFGCPRDNDANAVMLTYRFEAIT